jgi:hypothetical protein
MSYYKKRHYCSGPGIFDAACGVRGADFLTVNWLYVTCDNCKKAKKIVANRNAK